LVQRADQAQVPAGQFIVEGRFTVWRGPEQESWRVGRHLIEVGYLDGCR
jgi:hypothetical protein